MIQIPGMVPAYFEARLAAKNISENLQNKRGGGKGLLVDYFLRARQ
jgi:hypothetical protein